jgi:transcriptional regulator with XRE-family HTH domain
MSLQSREDLIAELRSKKYRDAFVSARVSNTLALQIRAMRQARGWSQAQLAEALGTSQNAVYRLESPRYGKATVTTLKRLASIFDVGLSVWFVPFSKLVDRVTNLSTEDILVPSFDNDSGFHERVAALQQVQTTIAMATNPLLTRSFQRGTITYMNINKDVNQFTILGGSITIPLIGKDVTIMSEDTLVLVSGQNVFSADVIAVSCGNTLSSSAQTSGTNSEERTGYVGRGVVGTAA